MSRRLAAAALVAIASALAAHPAAAAPAPPEPRPSPVAIVVDTSGSMSESDGTGRIKIEGAKVALLDFLEQVEADTPIGLRNYPAEGEAEESEESCSEGNPRIPIESREPADMAAEIRGLQADGNTPTAAALKAAADELEGAGGTQGTIVLVSDGESNCGRDPCEVAAEVAESGIDLQTITVGFRVSGAGAEELQCIADQTGGKYISVHDNEGLAEAFDEISRPKMHLKVDYPPEVTAQVGNDPSGLVHIGAVVTNTGQRLARGAIARIRFDVAAGAPAVIRPIVHLGNLEPGESRRLAWVFRPSVPPSNRNPLPLPFTVVAGAQNTSSDAEFEATINVRDAYEDAGDAGPILASRRKIAILGDSYSAGEGADAYLPGTDTDANPCHRSRRTYLVEAFALPDESIVACSGALAGDVLFRQGGRTVESQRDRLNRLREDRGVEAVVLTLGGNDAGFREIAMSCVIGRSDCSRTVYEDVPLWQRHGVPADEFVAKGKEAIEEQLPGAYRAINHVVNGPAARASGGPVPIIVLAYPLPTPLSPRSCWRMANQLSPGETEFLADLVVEVNGTIEGVVSEVRSEGVPIFFVPNTEMAFQPDHTVCDERPYARSLVSVNGAGFDHRGLLDAFRENVWRSIHGATPIDSFLSRLGLPRAGRSHAERAIQELVHPNGDGYEAMTRALLRWSQSPDAMAALRDLASAPVADPTVRIESSGDDLGQLVAGPTPTLQGGTSYPLNLQGFAPGSSLTIGIRSRYRLLGQAAAGDDGSLTTRVGIPEDLEPGDHTLTVAGAGAGGRPRTVEIPFHITGGGPPTAIVALLWLGTAGAVASALLGLALVIGSRRRRHGRGAGG